MFSVHKTGGKHMNFKNRNKVVMPDIEIADDDFDYDEEFYEDDENMGEMSQTKGDASPYTLITPVATRPNDETPLSSVVGHDNQKKELLLVIDWFKNSKQWKERGVSIPKGVILFGNPGNGKSLLIKEIIKYVEAPAFVFNGEQSNIVKGIIETFRKAKEAGHAIIVFDELDLLINKDRRVIRALQENLDGVESVDDILVLAATNDLSEIPSPLRRNGRLEKLIRIPNPTGQEAFEILKRHFESFNLTFPEDLDEDEVALSLNGISCAGVKAVVNDLVLRNGFENITLEMIYNSIYNITDKVKDKCEEDNLEVAIHEAGHAVVAKSFPQFFMINRLNISGASGEFHAKEVEKDFWPYDKVIADIKISMAGILAQKIISGRGSRGCDDDLQRARYDAYNLLNRCGYSSCWETLPAVAPGTRIDTGVKRRKMERKIEHLLKRCEKETSRYIKEHKSQIINLGNLLFEKKHLKSSEILSLIG